MENTQRRVDHVGSLTPCGDYRRLGRHAEPRRVAAAQRGPDIRWRLVHGPAVRAETPEAKTLGQVDGPRVRAHGAHQPNPSTPRQRGPRRGCREDAASLGLVEGDAPRDRPLTSQVVIVAHTGIGCFRVTGKRHELGRGRLCGRVGGQSVCRAQAGAADQGEVPEGDEEKAVGAGGRTAVPDPQDRSPMAARALYAVWEVPIDEGAPDHLGRDWRGAAPLGKFGQGGFVYVIEALALGSAGRGGKPIGRDRVAAPRLFGGTALHPDFPGVARWSPEAIDDICE